MFIGLETAGRMTAVLCIAVGSVSPNGVLAAPPSCVAPACAVTTTAPDPTSAETATTTQAAADPAAATFPGLPAATSTASGTGTAVTSTATGSTATGSTATGSTATGSTATTTAPPSTAVTEPSATTPPVTTPAGTTPAGTTQPTPSTDPVAPAVVDPPAGTASADYQAGYDAGYSAGFAAGRAAAGGTGTTPTGTSPTGTTTPTVTPATGTGTSAASRFGWGTPARVDDFTGGLGQWGVYNGTGHGGNGRRSPAAVTTRNGVLTIAGDANGTTGGMSWGPGARYGRWEARVQAPASDPSYHAVALLWPDAENWPVGGEVDFMEMMDASRQVTNMFLHYGASNSQVSGSVRIDATQWHDWAVEWTPDHIAAFVDGQEWWRTTNTAILPPGPMHLTLQLDWFPQGGSVRPSAMHVDQVAYYPL